MAFQYGRRPPKNAPALTFASFLSRTVPAHPAEEIEDVSPPTLRNETIDDESNAEESSELLGAAPAEGEGTSCRLLLASGQSD